MATRFLSQKPLTRTSTLAKVLLQKAMKDRVMTNKCNMDSILWFHLECPQRSSQFDDEDTFKLKFRDLFAQNKLD